MNVLFYSHTSILQCSHNNRCSCLLQRSSTYRHSHILFAEHQEFEQVNFDLKRAQGAALCRLVTQFKDMDGRYPDKTALAEMINKHEVQVVGDPPQEMLERLVGGE